MRFQTDVEENFRYEFPKVLEIDVQITLRIKKLLNRSLLRKIKRFLHDPK
jgi:hypothetical protein